MELLYIWIEDYKNIYRQGFNFSPKYRFEFTPKEFGKDEQGNETVIGGELTCNDENKEFPDNFFGKGISNVTAIVGENGSGKSSLLEIICSNM
jgi:AAA15 family ATPase/GTPase